MTYDCPACGGQLVVRVLLPRPEHRDIKKPVIVAMECTRPGCLVSEDDVHKLLGF